MMRSRKTVSSEEGEFVPRSRSAAVVAVARCIVVGTLFAFDDTDADIVAFSGDVAAGDVASVEDRRLWDLNGDGGCGLQSWA